MNDEVVKLEKKHCNARSLSATGEQYPPAATVKVIYWLQIILDM